LLDRLRALDLAEKSVRSPNQPMPRCWPNGSARGPFCFERWSA